MDDIIYFREGYKHAIKSAKSHFKAAGLLSKHLNYGIANSHLIIAAEEAIKAYAIYLKFNNKIDDEVYFTYFKSHKDKHNAINAAFSNLDIVEIIMDILREPIKRMAARFRKANGDSLPISKNVSRNHNDYIYEPVNKEEIRMWSEKAEEYRIRGFYVDFVRDKTRKWIAPSEITKDIFDNNSKIVSRLLKNVLYWQPYEIIVRDNSND